jgi:predicted metalloprotease
MRWQRGTSDQDIEDRRDDGPSRGPMRGGGLKLGLGGVLVLGVLSLVFKQDFFALFDQIPADTSSSTATGPARRPAAASAEEADRYEFVKFVINDVQDTWSRQLPAESGVAYRRAKLVLFRDAVDSACGYAQSASGPFYCPGDEKIYLDLGFYDELKQRFGASGDFAQAYVIAHEAGHHIQRILGIEGQVRRAQERRPDQAKQLSVAMELQADCLAGVWGHSTSQRNILETGDVESGLNAAAAIGDDRVQRAAGRSVHPEQFTHGSSAERVEWFRRGLTEGRVAACDALATR